MGIAICTRILGRTGCGCTCPGMSSLAGTVLTDASRCVRGQRWTFWCRPRLAASRLGRSLARTGPYASVTWVSRHFITDRLRHIPSSPSTETAASWCVGTALRGPPRRLREFPDLPPAERLVGGGSSSGAALATASGPSEALEADLVRFLGMLQVV